jgi:hypothetical protein
VRIVLNSQTLTLFKLFATNFQENKNNNNKSKQSFPNNQIDSSRYLRDEEPIIAFKRSYRKPHIRVNKIDE